MSITKELREWAHEHLYESGIRSDLLDIADRIDKAHKHAIGYVDDRDPDMMTENGWVRLPKDADGEYIQPSDIPYLTKANDGKRLAFYPPLELRQDGTWRLAGWAPDWYRILKPTVEDLLREFAGKVIDSQIPSVHPTYEEVIAEYAAKLRLAGDSE